MLPVLTTSDKSVENLILNTVKDNPNTSAKKIYNSITKAGITVTYHKIFEKMQDMVKKGVMIKNDKLYSVSNVWVERTTKFMETIHTKQMMITEKNMCFGADSVQKVELLTFDSFSNYANYVKNLKLKVLESLENSEILWLANHSVISLLSLNDRPLLASEIKKRNIKYYSIIRGNTYLDNFLLEFNRKIGIKNYKIDLNDNNQSIIGIYGDNLLYVIYPQELIQQIEDFFQKTKSFDHGSFKEIFDIVNTDHKISAILIKEKYLVDSYRKFIKSKFSNES